jgi:hypothetical protein
MASHNCPSYPCPICHASAIASAKQQLEQEANLESKSWIDSGSSGKDSTSSHICNCIGCCPKCSQCRTAPWHFSTCGSIAALNKAKQFIIEQAKGK